MAKFYWVKDGHRSKQLYNVRRVARAIIADYIEKNLHKTAEELKSDLDIWGNRKDGEWDGYGHHPFTLREHIKDNNRYFPETVDLDGGEEISISTLWGARGKYESKWEKLKKKIGEYGYTILEESEEIIPTSLEIPVSQEALRDVTLLKKFIKQIILYGPPGTGKTFRAVTEILPELLGISKSKMDDEQGNRWDIVQFHPSYNYEDFVRGVKVEAASGSGVTYSTVDGILGKICRRAEDNPDKGYALVIDEINRANVSAVLGELIYALEYRDKPIETPYAVGGDSTLTIPENLYIIGTMNTADRTIGQIDYAVRRRFSFVQCLPDKKVIDDDDASDIFSDIQDIFDKHTSPDYDANDVRVGHSYFMANSPEEFACKVIYQIVPILLEYVNDGVLLEGAKEGIRRIKQKFPDDILVSNDEDEDDSDADEDDSNEDKKKNVYFWERDGKFDINKTGRTVLSIVHDYVAQNPSITLGELQEWFPDRHKHAEYRGIKSEFSEKDRKRFFTNEDEKLNIGGQVVYVSREWGTGYESGKPGSFEDFINDIKEKSYTVRPCYVVNIGENERKRSWDACRELGFVSVSGKSKGGLSRRMFKRIEKGAIVFACLLRDSDGNKGFVGMGEVQDQAVPISRFIVDGLMSILDYSLNDGQVYRDKYPLAAEHADEDDPQCEWMISIDWRDSFPREKAEGKTGRGVTYCWFRQDILDSIKNKFKKNK